MNPVQPGATAVASPGSGSRPARPRYRRPSRLRRMGLLLLGAGGLIGVACGRGGSGDGPTADEWVQTDGAAGRINLDDVQQAYKDSFDDQQFKVSDFEKRVNEIYEGDHIVLVKVEKTGNQVDVSGWEDLNDSKQIDESTDDKLFTITQPLQDGAGYAMRGYGANSYYHSDGGFGNFVTGMFLGSLLSGGRTTYVTPPPAYDSLSGYRTSYRSGSGYSTQRSRNAAFGSSAASRFGSAATSSPVSPARSSYQSRQVNSGGFKSSGSTSRSIGSGGKITGGSSSGGKSGGSSGSGGKSGGSSSGGGASGGGGLVRL